MGLKLLAYLFSEPPNKPLSISSSLNAVPEGSSTTLTCNHDNTGTLTFAWSKDGQTISGTSSTLVISSFTSSDAGDYTCVVNETPLSSPLSDPISIYLAGKFCSHVCFDEHDTKNTFFSTAHPLFFFSLIL